MLSELITTIMINYSAVKIKRTLLALLICFITIPLSRFISPQIFLGENQLYLVWLPLSAMYSLLFIFGRYAVVPLIITFAIDNTLIVGLALPRAMILLFCQLIPVLVSCAIIRFQSGRRWRSGLRGKHWGMRIFWAGFFAPLLLKGSMYVVGQFFSFPVAMSGYFGHISIIYTIIDIQSLISAGLIFTALFYYPLRMIISPRYARVFWRNHCQPCLAYGHRIFTLYWFIALATILFVLCTPYISDLIAGYLVPLVFILYFVGIGRLGQTLIRILWSISAFLLVVYHPNFLHGVSIEYSLAFVLSVLISFTVCLFYMADIYARSERMRIRWREQAGETSRVGALNMGQGQIPERSSEQLHLLRQVEHAINKGSLLLYAQPIQNASGEGYYEILCRMRCGNAIIMPQQFIPLVSRFNLSQRFDMQVLEALCRVLHHYPGKHFSVNLLPHTLMQQDSAAQIIMLFKRYNLAPGTITIEVTEEQVFSDIEISMYNIQQLRNFGCSIAIDDFGTGYANYERLKNLQADIVKIDGCFVRDIATDPLDVIMVKSIIEMAKAKNMKVVAEYVETQEQRTRLLQLGVDYLQGYLIGKPQPLSELRV